MLAIGDLGEFGELVATLVAALVEAGAACSSLCFDSFACLATVHPAIVNWVLMIQLMIF
jgi:hypothetical protein